MGSQRPALRLQQAWAAFQGLPSRREGFRSSPWLQQPLGSAKNPFLGGERAALLCRSEGEMARPPPCPPRVVGEAEPRAGKRAAPAQCPRIPLVWRACPQPAGEAALRGGGFVPAVCCPRFGARDGSRRAAARLEGETAVRRAEISKNCLRRLSECLRQLRSSSEYLPATYGTRSEHTEVGFRYRGARSSAETWTRRSRMLAVPSKSLASLLPR